MPAAAAPAALTSGPPGPPRRRSNAAAPSGTSRGLQVGAELVGVGDAVGDAQAPDRRDERDVDDVVERG